MVQKSNFSFAHPELLVPIKYTMPLQGGEEINGFYVWVARTIFREWDIVLAIQT